LIACHARHRRRVCEVALRGAARLARRSEQVRPRVGASEAVVVSCAVAGDTGYVARQAGTRWQVEKVAGVGARLDARGSVRVREAGGRIAGRAICRVGSVALVARAVARLANRC